MTVFSYLNPNVTLLKTKNVNNDTNKNDANNDISFISNAVILNSISYHIDKVTANQILSNDIETDINNSANGKNKKRDRTDTDISIIKDACKVAVYNDKLDDGYLIIYDSTGKNTDDKQEEILKPVKQYSIYAD